MKLCKGWMMVALGLCFIILNASGAVLGADLEMSGNFTVGAEHYFGKLPGENPDTGDGQDIPLQQFPTSSQIGFTQSLSLSLEGTISKNVDFSLTFANGGVWGVQFASDGSYGANPTFLPLALDDAYIRYKRGKTEFTVGRFRFSLGPSGLISAVRLNPLEAAALDTEIEGVEFTAVYSRLSSEYYLGTPYVIDSDDYLAIRLEKKFGKKTSAGVNLLISGLVNETAQSIDFSTILNGRKVWGEAARYRPDPKSIGFQEGMSYYAGLVGYNIYSSSESHTDIKLGWIDPNFTPTFSSLAYSSLGEIEEFENGSYGIQLSHSMKLSKVTSAAGKLLLSRSTHVSEPAKASLRISVSKELSSSSILDFSFNYDLSKLGGHGKSRLSWGIFF